MKKLSEPGITLSGNQPQSPQSKREKETESEGERERAGDWQPDTQEALPKCNVNEKEKRERKPPAEKRGKAFHLRIYLEFENLMRWADGQIMLCKWYVHKSQTDSATHAHWQPGVLLMLLPLPRLVVHRIRCTKSSIVNDWQLSHVKPVRKMNRLTIDKRNAWQVHAQCGLGFVRVGGEQQLLFAYVGCQMLPRPLCHTLSLCVCGSICVWCVFPKLQRNCVPDLAVNAGSAIFFHSALHSRKRILINASKSIEGEKDRKRERGIVGKRDRETV